MYQELYHHGVAGQHWGVKNGPPYPLTKEAKKALRYSKKAQKYQNKANQMRTKSHEQENKYNESLKDHEVKKKSKKVLKLGKKVTIAILSGAAVGGLAWGAIPMFALAEAAGTTVSTVALGKATVSGMISGGSGVVIEKMLSRMIPDDK